MKNNRFARCGYCGGELVDFDECDYKCQACSRVTYNSPEGAVGVMIYREPDEVLISVRGIPPGVGQHDSVGGFLQYMEQPEDGARREFLEETGQEVINLKLIGAVTGPYTDKKSVLALLYRGELADPDGKLIPQDDVAELIWLPIDQVKQSNFGRTKQVPLIKQGYKDWLNDKN